MSGATRLSIDYTAAAVLVLLAALASIILARTARQDS
jgi:hypothetical protein